MSRQLHEEIRDKQKATWNKFSGGWKKWDEVVMSFLSPMGQAMIDYLKPIELHSILDIAAGTGEPGLTMASMMKRGKVTITDLAEEMLVAAKEKAVMRRISNISFHACDVMHMPFPDNNYDAVSCRFGFMFFPDMQLAANEMYRVLKPGGRIAAAVWDVPEKNFWVTATMGTIMRMMNLVPPPPEEPGMFRCAKPDRMKEIFTKAGFSDYKEIEIKSFLKTGTADKYWEMITEVGAPIAAALSLADDELYQKIKQEVTGLIQANYPKEVAIEGNAIILMAYK
ncbi:MAG TPA: methyltransferase domain-containing protein [Chitinophagaceae bacterium]|nr:methyltransferase domain-containing protein [Chitinophagaceae bacterium]